MSYEYYIKQPKIMAEIKLNQILARKPFLFNALDRGVKTLINHLLTNNSI